MYLFVVLQWKLLAVYASYYESQKLLTLFLNSVAAGANTLKTLLSFAVGGILGDVFLHSLPEIWANDVAKRGEDLFESIASSVSIDVGGMSITRID